MNQAQITPYVLPGIAAGLILVKKSSKKAIIIQAVCNHFCVTEDDLKSKSRKRVFTEPRQIACYFLRKLTKMTWKKIGKLFDRHYSTALNEVQAVEELMIGKAYRLNIIILTGLIETKL